MRGKAFAGSELSFGDFGLKATTVAWMTAAQIEAARKTIMHELRKGGRTWVRVFPDKPVTERASGHRMGGGKGEVARYVAVVKPGRVLFEIAGTTRQIALEAFRKAASKLPTRSRTIEREV